jgi:hypothetical protein
LALTSKEVVVPRLLQRKMEVQWAMAAKILLTDTGTVSDELDACQTNVGVLAQGGLKYVS